MCAQVFHKSAMVVDVPSKSQFYWNPYSPKLYTIVTSQLDNNGIESLSASSQSTAEEKSMAHSSTLEDEEADVAWALIASLRKESTTDAQILEGILKLPPKTQLAMIVALESSPSSMLELCEKERGNVLSQLMGAVGGESCGEFVRFVMDNAMRLATNQSGCIAFTRVFDAATPEQRELMNEFALTNFYPLAVHAFGNYVVQRVIQDGSSVVHARVASLLVMPGKLMELTSNKFGSHVVECFVKRASFTSFAVVTEVLLSDYELISFLAFDPFGNYVLQNFLKTLFSIAPDSSLAYLAWERIPPIATGSPHAPNINRAMGLGRRMFS